MARINLNQLFYFYIVAKDGSIKDASARLNLTQPTISIQIKKLEENLGFPLFIRQHRKLTLSSKGKYLLKKAERIFQLADELVAELPKMGTRIREPFRVGVLNSISSAFVRDFSMDLWTDSSILTSIVHGNIQIIRDALDTGAIDFALTDESFGTQSKYRSISLGHDRLVAVANSDFKRRRLKTFPNSLSGLPYFSFPSEGRTQSEINYYFARKNIRPTIAGIVDDISIIRELIKIGLGFSVLPYRSIREAINSGELALLGELGDVTFNLWGIMPSTSDTRKLIKRNLAQFFKLA